MCVHLVQRDAQQLTELQNDVLGCFRILWYKSCNRLQCVEQKLGMELGPQIVNRGFCQLRLQLRGVNLTLTRLVMHAIKLRCNNDEPIDQKSDLHVLPKIELGNIVSGAFTPVLAKHSKSFSLIDCISVGVDRMQRNFEPMRKQVEAWQKGELTDVTAKVVIYEAFVEGKLEAPKHLARTVHDLYFEPRYEEFRPRTIWSLSNAFTSAFKKLEPIPQFKATAKLGEFLEARFSQSF
jgi:hypothetical protein